MKEAAGAGFGGKETIKQEVGKPLEPDQFTARFTTGYGMLNGAFTQEAS